MHPPSSYRLILQIVDYAKVDSLIMVMDDAALPIS